MKKSKAGGKINLSDMKLLAFGLSVLLILSWLSLISTSIGNRDVVNCFGQDSEPHQCRFWAMAAPCLPESVVMDHLVNGSSSLKILGASNYNGWGLAYYNDTEPKVLRGKLSADVDPTFDLAVQELAKSGARVGVGHVRMATSGATDIPNPHPFMRYKGGKWWAFGHNGDLPKNSLRELIGPEYLEENPPTVGDNWSDPRVVDSDLYMLYILKCTEESSWNVTCGIAEAVRVITQKASGTMNFFLTDGATVWGFCMGNTLYYYNESSPRYSVIASQPPTSDIKDWIALTDYNLILLTTNNSPIIIDNVTTITESIGHPFGDLNEDKRVDGKDVAIVAQAFASYPTHPRWNAWADLNQDNKIDGKDIVIVAKNFGEHTHNSALCTNSFIVKAPSLDTSREVADTFAEMFLLSVTFPSAFFLSPSMNDSVYAEKIKI